MFSSISNYTFFYSRVYLLKFYLGEKILCLQLRCINKINIPKKKKKTIVTIIYIYVISKNDLILNQPDIY